MPGKQSTHMAELNHIRCNTEVHLQIPTPTKPLRLRTHLIGVDPHNSIILMMGTDKNWQAAKDFINDGQTVIVRLFDSNSSEAHVLAFRTTVNSMFTGAGRWLVLTYPKEIQQVGLRQHSRLPIHITSTILSSDTQQPLATGHLSDISILGGAFTGEWIKTEVKDKRFVLQIHLDGDILEANITIKNQNTIDIADESYQYGFTLDGDSTAANDLVQQIIIFHLKQTNNT